MEAPKLRSLATAYAMSFLQNLERLVKGTLDGIPNQNGQTLEEEMETPGTHTHTHTKLDQIPFGFFARDHTTMHIRNWILAGHEL